MICYILLICAIRCAFGGDVTTVAHSVSINERIVGGKKADINDFPWQVSLLVLGNHNCGGSIIGNFWVVTAAHCVLDVTLNELTIRSGSNLHSIGGSLHYVRQIIIHPEFNVYTQDKDIAVVKVLHPFENNRIIGLMPQGLQLPLGTGTIVTGWGSLLENGPGSPFLLQTTVLLMSEITCNKQYEGEITKNMICAGWPIGGRDACQGDSGGPLIFERRLIGIVSWGNGCARREFPGIYTRISAPSIRQFINKFTGL